MPLFKYRAINNRGHEISGILSAANDMDLENRLKNLELDLVSFKDASKDLFNNITKIHQKDLIVFCIQMEQLISAGVPILEIISDLRDSAESNNMKNLLEDIHETIKSGTMLSDTLSHYPEIFDEVFVGLIAAGEKTGKLNDVFGHLGTHIKWIYEINKKIRKSLYYPAFMLFLMGIIVSIMMMMVIPKLTSFLTSQNIELPFYTKALISTSDFFVKYWYLVILAPILTIGTIKILDKISYNFSYMYDNFKLKLPVFGPLIIKMEMARFCRFFSITYKSGISILDCMHIASNTISNKVIKESILDAKQKISEGKSLTEALRLTNQLPSLVLRMISVGENSGNIDESLANVNFFYDKEINETVDRLISLIQPTLTIVLGGLMLWISMAVFGPLYGSFSKLNL